MIYLPFMHGWILKFLEGAIKYLWGLKPSVNTQVCKSVRRYSNNFVQDEVEGGGVGWSRHSYTIHIAYLLYAFTRLF